MEWIHFDEEGSMRQRFQEIDERSEKLRGWVNISRETQESFDEMCNISLIYHENGLEGVVLTYPEIKSAVDNKIVSDISLLPTYQDIKNQKQCVDLVFEKARTKRFNVTVSFLKELHGLLVNDPDEAGVYRKDIPIHRTYFHEIAQPSKIHAGLLKVLDYMKAKQEKELHFIEYAANIHHRFMRIFPFSNFSGIIGRLMTNFILTRAGYFPVIIHSSDRQRYYEALRASERDFRLFMAESLENSLENASRFFTGRETTALKSDHHLHVAP